VLKQLEYQVRQAVVLKHINYNCVLIHPISPFELIYSMEAATDTSVRFGSKLAHVQKAGNLLTLTDDAPINQRQIIIESVKPAGDAIVINLPFGNSFLMNSVQSLVDIVDWEWMEENVMD